MPLAPASERQKDERWTSICPFLLFIKLPGHLCCLSSLCLTFLWHFCPFIWQTCHRMVRCRSWKLLQRHFCFLLFPPLTFSAMCTDERSHFMSLDPKCPAARKVLFRLTEEWRGCCQVPTPTTEGIIVLWISSGPTSKLSLIQKFGSVDQWQCFCTPLGNLCAFQLLWSYKSQQVLSAIAWYLELLSSCN